MQELVSDSSLKKTKTKNSTTPQAKRQDRLRKDLQYKTLKKQNRFEDAQKLEQQLEAIKNELDNENVGMAAQAKGLLASELRRYSNRRFFELRRRCAHFANEQVKEADREIEHWQTLLKDLGVDQERMSDLSEASVIHGKFLCLFSLARSSSMGMDCVQGLWFVALNTHTHTHTLS